MRAKSFNTLRVTRSTNKRLYRDTESAGKPCGSCRSDSTVYKCEIADRTELAWSTPDLKGSSADNTSAITRSFGVLGILQIFMVTVAIQLYRRRSPQFFAAIKM